MPRIATSGWLIIGVKKLPPILPKLEIVIDPPKNSFLSIFKSLHSLAIFFNSCPSSVISFLSASLIFGGSITISSLGSIGGSFFTPIINQPEVAILGIGKAEKKQVFVGDKYENKIMLPLSLSYDHRVIDGAEGARFCAHLRQSLGKDFAYKLAV